MVSTIKLDTFDGLARKVLRDPQHPLLSPASCHHSLRSAAPHHTSDVGETLNASRRESYHLGRKPSVRARKGLGLVGSTLAHWTPPPSPAHETSCSQLAWPKTLSLLGMARWAASLSTSSTWEEIIVSESGRGLARFLSNCRHRAHKHGTPVAFVTQMTSLFSRTIHQHAFS